MNANLLRWRGAVASLLLFSGGAALAVPEVQFTVYDENGQPLTYAQTVARMSNGHGEDNLASGNVDLNTLQIVSMWTLYEEGGQLMAWFPNVAKFPRQGLMVHWPTESTGYSNWLLDNGGTGFTTSGKMNFNERLARDARRQFDQALARRTDFTPSAEFTDLRADIATCFAELDAANVDPARGAAGQRCLDLIAQAMQMLLREYGMQRAAGIDDPWWGVTIYPKAEASFATSSDKQAVDDLAALFGPGHAWARIVMNGDGKDNLAWIRQIVEYADSRGVNTMGQLFDSRDQKKITRAVHRNRVKQALAYPGFDKFDAWEVGNEVNGGWLGPHKNTRDKIVDTIAEVKKTFPAKTRCLTFYWYSIQDTKATSLFNWIQNWITPAIANDIQCVTMSTYTDQQPLGFSWDLILNRLQQIFPGKPVMIGELDYYEDLYFEGGPGLTEDERALDYVANRYPAAFAMPGVPGSTGGVFWWYFDDDDMIGRTPMWHVLHDTYCEVYPGEPVCAVP